MRLFVATYPSTAALDDLEAMTRELDVSKVAAGGTNVRITSRSLWHVTLAFLGDVPDERLVDVARAVDRATDRAGVAQPRLNIAGGGRFGRGRFTVLWAGLRGDTDGLGALAAAVTSELRHARLPYDPKRFHPHLTIARPGDRAPSSVIAEDIATLDSYRGPQWTCSEIFLVASHQGPKPVHEAVHVSPVPAL